MPSLFLGMRWLSTCVESGSPVQRLVNVRGVENKHTARPSKHIEKSSSTANIPITTWNYGLLFIFIGTNGATLQKKASLASDIGYDASLFMVEMAFITMLVTYGMYPSL